MALAGDMAEGTATEMLEDWIAAGAEATAAKAGAPWVDEPSASEIAGRSPAPGKSVNSKVSVVGKDGAEEGISLPWPMSCFAMFLGVIAGVEVATAGTAPATGWLAVWTSRAAAAIPKDEVGTVAKAAGSLWVALSNDLCASISGRDAVPAREAAAGPAISSAEALKPALAPALLGGASGVGGTNGFDPPATACAAASAAASGSMRSVASMTVRATEGKLFGSTGSGML
jgi:hypothetical protein